MSPDLPDAIQRAQLLDPTRSFIVQAPAGSGKTGVLIQRYLRLLALVSAPEEVVAITFTLKAATEMKERVLTALQQADEQVATNSTYAAYMLQLAAHALAHHRKQGTDLLQLSGRLRIQTIDSLCLSLLRQMPIVSELGGLPQLVPDARALYLQAAQSTIAFAGEDEPQFVEQIAAVRRVLQEQDMNLAATQTLIVEMLACRDQWQTYMLNVTQGSKQFASQLNNTSAQIIYDSLQKLQQRLSPAILQQWLKLLQFAASHISEPSLLAAAKLTTWPDLVSTTAHEVLALWLAIIDLCLTRSGTWRRKIDKRQGFPSAAKAEKETWRALVEDLQEMPDLRQQLLRIRSLPRARFTDLERQRVLDLCSLLQLAEFELQQIFAKQQKIDFIGVMLGAINALGSDDNPTNLAFYLEHQIQHLLVDEYQDTSLTQETLIRRLIAGWADGDGHSLFFVGDPMQSIYRFRQAEISLFINTFHRQRLGQIQLSAIRLTSNLRSTTQIIDWINSHLPASFAAHDDAVYGAVKYHPFTAHRSEQGSVNCYRLSDPSSIAEAEQVITIIQRIRQQDPETQIAILARNRAHLTDILHRLQRADIKCRAVEMETLGQRAAIQDLLSLTRAWLHFADRIAWLSILRAPWCGMCLQQLSIIAADPKKSVWDSLLQAQDTGILPDPRAQRFIMIFSAAMEQRDRQSLAQTIRSLWCRLGGPSTLHHRSELADVDVYLSCLASWEQKGDIDDLSELATLVEKRYASPDVQADDKLQAMTIHKAKGLEFAHVILPGLGKRSRTDSDRLLRWSLWPSEHTPAGLLIAPIKTAGSVHSDIYQFLRDLEQTQQEHELQRLLYVALTRARDSLHLIAQVNSREKNGEIIHKAPIKNSLLHCLWHVFESTPIVPASTLDAPKASSSDDAQAQQLSRLSLNWSLPDPPLLTVRRMGQILSTPETSLEYLWAGHAIRHIGTVVHEFLRQIAEARCDGWDVKRVIDMRDNYCERLFALGVSGAELAAAAAQVEQALLQTLGDPQGRWILDPCHIAAHNEYALSGIYQGEVINIIIDRTFIDQHKVCWIVDYKISPHAGGDTGIFFAEQQERHLPQLQRYAALLAGLGRSNIKLGLYFPLQQHFIDCGYATKSGTI